MFVHVVFQITSVSVTNTGFPVFDYVTDFLYKPDNNILIAAASLLCTGGLCGERGRHSHALSFLSTTSCVELRSLHLTSTDVDDSV